MLRQEDERPKGESLLRRIAVWIWRLFSSVRLAVILIFVITGLSLLGALVIQVPSEVAGDPQLYSSWIETVARSKVGGWATLLSFLRLFDVFHSPWFIIAGTLLMFNIFICSVNRWSSISLSIRGSTIKHLESFYTTGNTRAEITSESMAYVEAARLAEEVLKDRGYRIRTQNDPDKIYVAADKNRFLRLGTYFSHLSLILFVLAFITGNYLGFSDTQFAVPIGQEREVGHGTALSLRLISFVDEYYDNGMPKDYRSQVILYEDGKEVEQALIRVNHPLKYKGVRIYQVYFGPAVEIVVYDESGREIFNGNVMMDSSFSSQEYRRSEGFFELSELGLSIRIIGSAVNTFDPIIPEGQVAIDIRQGGDQIDLKLVELGTSHVVGGLEFDLLGESQFSGFQISRDPTNILIWIASTLFIIGICAVLYFPYRQVWVLSLPKGQKNSHLFIRIITPRSYNITSELSTLVKKIEKAI